MARPQRGACFAWRVVVGAVRRCGGRQACLLSMAHWGCGTLCWRGVRLAVAALRDPCDSCRRAMVPIVHAWCVMDRTGSQAILNQYNQEEGPFVIVGCAGGTDALSGTASFHSVWPGVSGSFHA